MTNKLFYTFVLALIACCIEVDISVPSLPDISNYFDISDGMTQMTIAVNFFGICLSAALYGPLSENFGRRKVMLVGNVIMFVGSFGCMIATSIEFLLISRFLQGLGASSAVVIIFAMIADICKGKEANDVIGRISSIITIIMSVAPITGSFINETIGWRGNYGAVFLVSFLSWVVLYFVLPETKKDLEPLNFKQILRDYYKLITCYKFLITSAAIGLIFAGYMSFVACGSFLYTETLGLSIMSYSLHQGFFIACFSVVSQKIGLIRNYISESNCLKYGVVMQQIAAFILLFLGVLEVSNSFIITANMALFAVGAAFCSPLLMTKVFEIYPEIKGASSSASMSIRMLITAVFVTLISLFYDGTLLIIAIFIFIVCSLATLLSTIILKKIKFSDV